MAKAKRKAAKRKTTNQATSTPKPPAATQQPKQKRPRACDGVRNVRQQSRCPKCDSPSRTKYSNVRCITSGGNLVIWRNTTCKDCGQTRIDRELLVRSEMTPEDLEYLRLEMPAQEYRKLEQ